MDLFGQGRPANSRALLASRTLQLHLPDVAGKLVIEGASAYQT